MNAIVTKNTHRPPNYGNAEVAKTEKREKKIPKCDDIVYFNLWFHRFELNRKQPTAKKKKQTRSCFAHFIFLSISISDDVASEPN